MMKKVVLAVIIIIAAISLLLYLQNPVDSENKTEDNPATFVNESFLNEKEIPENNSESAVTVTGETVLLNDYPDALNIGERAQYDEYTNYQYPAGDDKNDISVSVEETRFSGKIYVKDLYSGSEFFIEPQQDYRYILVKVMAAPLGEYLLRHTSPVTNSFEILDSSNVYTPLLNISEEKGVIIINQTSWDTMINERFVIKNVGEIYVGKTIFSSLNNAEGSGPFSGWIIFEVPDSFVISPDTYVKFSPGKNDFLWKLHDIRADTDVYINQESGNIRIVYKGGPDQYLVRGMEATLEKPDGSVLLKSIEKSEDEESLSQWSELIISGSGSPEEKELLTVKLIRLDGEKFTKYQTFV